MSLSSVRIHARYLPGQSRDIPFHVDICRDHVPLLQSASRTAISTATSTCKDDQQKYRHSIQTRVTASAATSIAASATSGINAEVLGAAVAGSIIYNSFLFLAMILLPRWMAVRRMMHSYRVFIPLALTYLILLANSWTPDTLSVLMPGSLQAGLSGGFNPQFFPKLGGIAALFSRAPTAASWLLHILAINLFMGRSIYYEGLSKSVPTHLSLLLASIFGPLGFLAHQFTMALYNAFPWLQPDSKERVFHDGKGGKIIIMPYDYGPQS